MIYIYIIIYIYLLYTHYMLYIYISWAVYCPYFPTHPSKSRGRRRKISGDSGDGLTEVVQGCWRMFAACCNSWLTKPRREPRSRRSGWKMDGTWMENGWNMVIPKDIKSTTFQIWTGLFCFSLPICSKPYDPWCWYIRISCMISGDFGA